MPFDVNAKDRDGTSPLLTAVLLESLAIVSILITVEGFDVNAQNKHGLSPLLAAVSKRNVDIVERLLASKTIDVNIKDRFGISPLESMILAGYCSDQSNIVDQLLAVRDIDIPDALMPNLRRYDRERTADTGYESMLCTAIRMGDTRLVHLLVGKGMFDVNVTDREGYSALRLAAEQPDKTMFKFFVVRSETNLDIEDAYGRSLLSWAAEVGNVTAALTLLSTGRVNLHHIDHSGLTPLQKAERNGHRMIATMLQARLDATIVPVQNLAMQQ
ncbi:hypothetical protein E8E11_000971 [Didymella keratinophila]|nr:hypothetical protein E8E11_000971 [Didymella keratinophila]